MVDIQLTPDSVIAFSGGKDSLLLTYLVHQVNPNVPVLVFDALLDNHQKQWIHKCVERLQLTAFSYRPSMLEYKDGSIVSHYVLGHSTIPLIQDIIHSDSCGLDKGRKALNKAPLAQFVWDQVLLGSRKSDTHALVPQLDFSHLPVQTPLWELSDKQVWSLIKEYGIETDPRVYIEGDEAADSGNINGCFNCLAPQGSQVFCPKLQTLTPTIGT